MTKKRKIVLLNTYKKGAKAKPKSSDGLETYGELAINYHADNEFLMTMNSSGDIATFSSDSVIDKKLDKKADTVVGSDDVNINEKSVSIVQEKSYTDNDGNVTLLTVGNVNCGEFLPTIPKDEAKLGDVVYYIEQSEQYCYVPYEGLSPSIASIEGVQPIGVVAIPTVSGNSFYSGDTYSVSNLAMISLTDMSCSSPDTGAISGTSNSTGTTYLYWGNNGADTTLKNVQNKNYFNGKCDTEAILSNTAYTSGQTGWTASTSITNSSSAGYAPAFECCWRYHTSGTKQGDWYLPSAGELYYSIGTGYTSTNKSTSIVVNNTLNKLAELYPSLIIRTIATSGNFWSSSEYGAYGAWYLYTYYGSVSSSSKGNGRLVRAFCRV